METKCVCKVEPSSPEIITKLTQDPLETILCLIPTKEAVKTSILSKKWRYKWTTIPKLNLALSQLSKENQNPEPFHDLLQILISHQGQINDFTLNMDLNATGFDQILLHLLENHSLQKLTLSGSEGHDWYTLPVSVFSFHHLTDLHLSWLDINHPSPIFTGVGSLTSLSLQHVGISTESRIHLLSNRPSLKSLNLLIGQSHLGAKYCKTTELFECLPIIEQLTTFWMSPSGLY